MEERLNGIEESAWDEKHGAQCLLFSSFGDRGRWWILRAVFAEVESRLGAIESTVAQLQKRSPRKSPSPPARKDSTTTCKPAPVSPGHTLLADVLRQGTAEPEPEPEPAAVDGAHGWSDSDEAVVETSGRSSPGAQVTLACCLHNMHPPLVLR